jgi:hypothetical protein
MIIIEILAFKLLLTLIKNMSHLQYQNRKME